MSFTVLQNRHFKVNSLNLCSSMDMAALISSEGILNVYRTFSWEIILSKNVKEELGSIPSTISFSPSGKVIAIGGDVGNIVILRIEQIECTKAFRSMRLSQLQSTPNIIDILFWANDEESLNYNVSNSASGSSNKPILLWECYKYGGLDLVQKYGLREYFESGEDAALETFPVSELIKTVAGSVLYAGNSITGIVCAYLLGIFPYFTVDLKSVSSRSSQILSDMQWRGVGGLPSTSNSLFIASSVNSTLITSSILVCPLSSLVTELSGQILPWRENNCALWLGLLNDLTRVEELLASCARKWKDATKVLPAKLGLLRHVLVGYNLSFTASEFYQTIAFCGLWHPAAHTAMTQHWNEAGLARFRASLEVTTKTLLSILVMKMKPLLVNIHLRIRELLGVSATLDKSYELLSKEQISKGKGEQSYSKLLSQLDKSCALLQLKLDEMSQEASLASHRLLLFTQFIRGYLVPASRDEEATSNVPAWDSRAFINLFDPRVRRVVSSASGGEELSGTFLYAHFLDELLPEAASVNQSAHPTSLATGSSHVATSSGNASVECVVQAELVEKFMQAAEADIYGDKDTHIEELLRHSFCRQLKRVRALLQICIEEFPLVTSPRLATSGTTNNHFEGGFPDLNQILTSFYPGNIFGYQSTVGKNITLNTIASSGQTATEMTLQNALIAVLVIDRPIGGVAQKSGADASQKLAVLCKELNEESPWYGCVVDVLVSRGSDEEGQAHYDRVQIYTADVSGISRFAVVGLMSHDTDIKATGVTSSDNTCLMFKINLSEVSFAPLGNSTSPRGTSVAMSGCAVQGVSGVVHPLSVPMSQVTSLEVCAARGVVAVTDMSGKVLIFDAEDVEDEEDEEEMEESD